MSDFNKIVQLITTNSFYDKIEENIVIDQTIFDELENFLTEQLTIPIDDILSNEIDYLSSILIFLLEHTILELNLQLFELKTKSFKPKLVPFQQNIKQSKQLLDLLFKYFHRFKLDEFLLLNQNSQPIYHHCLCRLIPFLSKTTYQQHSLALHVFILIIQSLSPSSLTECFDMIFPICLITLDDSSIDFKLISFSLLDQLETHLTTTELLLFNRANVVLYGLEQNLSHRGDSVLFFECLLSIVSRWLNLIENPIYSGKHLFVRTSQYVERFIRDCLFETNIDYRCLIMKCFRIYLERLDLFAIRHFQRWLELIDDSIENSRLRFDAFEFLIQLIDKFQPRINQHRYEIMKILIRCIMKIVHDQTDDSQVKNLLQILHRSTTNNYVEDSLQSLINTSELDFIYRDYLQKLLDSLNVKQ